MEHRHDNISPTKTGRHTVKNMNWRAPQCHGLFLHTSHRRARSILFVCRVPYALPYVTRLAVELPYSYKNALGDRLTVLTCAVRGPCGAKLGVTRLAKRTQTLFLHVFITQMQIYRRRDC